jgi:hypothetical protein
LKIATDRLLQCVTRRTRPTRHTPFTFCRSLAANAKYYIQLLLWDMAWRFRPGGLAGDTTRRRLTPISGAYLQLGDAAERPVSINQQPQR